MFRRHGEEEKICRWLVRQKHWHLGLQKCMDERIRYNFVGVSIRQSFLDSKECLSVEYQKVKIKVSPTETRTPDA